MQNNNSIIHIAIAAVAAFALGFFCGMEYQKKQSQNTLRIDVPGVQYEQRFTQPPPSNSENFSQRIRVWPFVDIEKEKK
jgi:hypothetical protein